MTKVGWTHKICYNSFYLRLNSKNVFKIKIKFDILDFENKVYSLYRESDFTASISQSLTISSFITSMNLFCSSSLPPAWQLHIQHSLSSISSIPPLWLCLQNAKSELSDVLILVTPSWNHNILNCASSSSASINTSKCQNIVVMLMS